MGPERLTGPSLALLLLLAGGACGGHTTEPSVGISLPARAPDRRHVQVVHFAPPAARTALLDRLRKTSGPAWALGREGPADDDVEPIRLFLRRAWRVDPLGTPVLFTPAEAEADAVAFVTANAEVLGLAQADVVTLDVQTVTVPKQHDGHAVGVRFVGRIPMRGYEAFESLASTIAILVFVDVDRQIRAFTNLSRIHPRLSIDTRPVLDAEDPRILRAVIGRELFIARETFVDDDDDAASLTRRESIGKVGASDVTARELTVFVSPGPMGAYVAYHLAYALVVGRRGKWFRFIVSADTGELLEDAVAATEDPGSLL